MNIFVRRLQLCVALSLLSVSGICAQTVHFEALPGGKGKASSSACVRVDDEGTIATVVELRSDPKKAVLHVEGKKIPLKFVVSNLESRVAIYRLPDDAKNAVSHLAVFASSRGLKPAVSLYTSPANRDRVSKLVGHVYRFQGKVLPLAVLRVNHEDKAPVQGTGIYDAAGKLVGIVRQTVYNNSNSSYCLPAEVITRIIADHKRNGSVSRCWIGIIMDERVAPPIVESVRPSSPAKKAGLESGDVILSIGGQAVMEYAEVVDAFYYLVAGESQKFRVLRGTKVMEFDVTPEVSPGR